MVGLAGLEPGSNGAAELYVAVEMRLLEVVTVEVFVGVEGAGEYLSASAPRITGARDSWAR